MSDLAAYLDTAAKRAMRSVAQATDEYLLAWCDRLACAPQELAERFDLRTETTTDLDGEVLRSVTRMKLEPKDTVEHDA